MESEKGKNNFLKKHGLCAVRLMERLSGWRGQWRAGWQLAGSSPAPCGHSEGLARPPTEAGGPVLPPRDGPQCPGRLQLRTPLSTHTHLEFHQINPSTDVRWAPSGLKAPGARVLRCKSSPWFCQPLQLAVGCPGLSPRNRVEAAPPAQGDRRTWSARSRFNKEK